MTTGSTSVGDALFYYAGAMCAQDARPYQAPSSAAVRAGARAFPFSVWMHHGIYAKLSEADPYGSNYAPYIIPPQMRRGLQRAINAAQRTKCQRRLHICHAYTSPGVALRGNSSKGIAPLAVDDILREARKLRAFGFQGVYVDGLSWFYNGRRVGTVADNLKLIRGLGKLFKHVLAHLTHYNGQGRVNPPELQVETEIKNIQVLIGEWVPDRHDPEACHEYVETQIRARLDAGVRLMLTPKAWDLCPAEFRPRISTYACSLMRPDYLGGSLFSDGLDYGPYKSIIAARAEFAARRAGTASPS